MIRTETLLAGLLAVTLVAAGAAAAMPGNAPDGVSATNETDDAPRDGAIGPPGGLLAPVPDFVSDVHDTVGEFVTEGGDSLGEAIRAITPGDARPN